MAAPALIRVLSQVTQADCGITALAMLLGRSYEEVSKVALVQCKRPHRSGLWEAELLRIARKLGVTLRRAPFDEDGTGLLSLRKKSGEGHWAVLFQGVVINPSDAIAYDLSTYLHMHKYEVRRFLVV